MENFFIRKTNEGTVKTKVILRNNLVFFENICKNKDVFQNSFEIIKVVGSERFVHCSILEETIVDSRLFVTIC